MRAISSSQRSDGFRKDSGPSGGDPCRRAIRAIATLPVGREAFHLNPLAPTTLSSLPRPQHQFCGAQPGSKIPVFQCFEYDALGIVEGLFEFFH